MPVLYLNRLNGYAVASLNESEQTVKAVAFGECGHEKLQILLIATGFTKSGRLGLRVFDTVSLGSNIA